MKSVKELKKMRILDPYFNFGKWAESWTLAVAIKIKPN
jgi:hypothetical protein